MKFVRKNSLRGEKYLYESEKDNLYSKGVKSIRKDWRFEYDTNSISLWCWNVIWIHGFQHEKIGKKAKA